MTSESARNKSRQYAKSLRKQIIEAYGSKCVCCGEARFHFLSIDHKNNDGQEHRLSLRRGRKKWVTKTGVCREGSIPFWNDLKRRGYPKDAYQCLCYNCNIGRHRNSDRPSICPHELERGEIVSVALDVAREEFKESQLDWLAGKPVGAVAVGVDVAVAVEQKSLEGTSVWGGEKR